MAKSTLTLTFLPHAEIADLGSEDRVAKLLKIVKTNKIILLEGRLRAEEEAELIRRTMEAIDERFKGIEISNVQEKEDQALTKRLKTLLINLILGDRRGLTIIGPATVVKEIKQDPDKIQLFMQDLNKQRRK